MGRKITLPSVIAERMGDRPEAPGRSTRVKPGDVVVRYRARQHRDLRWTTRFRRGGSSAFWSNRPVKVGVHPPAIFQRNSPTAESFWCRRRVEFGTHTYIQSGHCISGQRKLVIKESRSQKPFRYGSGSARREFWPGLFRDREVNEHQSRH